MSANPPQLEPGDLVWVDWEMAEVPGRFLGDAGLPGRPQARVEVDLDDRVEEVTVPLGAVRPRTPPPRARRALRLPDPPHSLVGWATVLGTVIAIVALVVALFTFGDSSNDANGTTAGETDANTTTGAQTVDASPRLETPDAQLEGRNFFKVRLADSLRFSDHVVVADLGDRLTFSLRAHHPGTKSVSGVIARVVIPQARTTFAVVQGELLSDLNPLWPPPDKATVNFADGARLQLEYVNGSTRIVEKYGHDQQCPRSKTTPWPDGISQGGIEIPTVGLIEPDRPCSEVTVNVYFEVRVRG